MPEEAVLQKVEPEEVVPEQAVAKKGVGGLSSLYRQSTAL